MSLNELGEKSQATIILGEFVNKPKSNSHWLIVFGKCFSLVKTRSHNMFFSWTFDLLLINSRYLVIGAYFSPPQRNIVCEHKLHGKPIMKYLSWTCFWYWCWRNLFFNVKLKLLMNKFSQFHDHVFRSSRSQIFSKIGALKNFSILILAILRYISVKINFSNCNRRNQNSLVS